jgi:UPF0042 nucleotide-binding protein
MTTGEPSPTTVPTGIPALDAAAEAPRLTAPQVLIITGMSGAGRTRAAAVLEDLDWYVVDNLPAQMLTHLVGMMTHGPAGAGVQRLAAVVDVRGREFFADLEQVLSALKEAGTDYRMLFLDAADDVLVRRYEQVRRPHPLQGDGRILDGIEAERTLLASVRAEEALRVNVVSFGFKYGIPLDADHVVDVRFLANPYWVSELRHLTGRDAAVRDYVLGLPGATTFVDRYVDALEPVLAGYLHEEKRYVTIAVGCTGGKHRSVAVSDAIAARLRNRGQRVTVTARDLGKE